MYSLNSGSSYTAYAVAAAAFHVTVQPVPEPSTFALFGCAAAIAFAARRRSRV